MPANIITDIIIVLVIAVIIGGAGFYIAKEKKKGIRCIGCPYAKNCSGGCGTSQEKKQ